MPEAPPPDNRFSRIEQLYHQALERSEEERSVFLFHACDGDDELRSEVERLLCFDRDSGNFMESPAFDMEAQTMAREAEQGRKIDPLGQTIVHYRVLEKIGEGGMGDVYKALDTHLQRPVAIKILPTELVADPERRLRFVQEARAASALSHPNIVHVYDIDRADGTVFIAMEYVSGKTLGELIPRKGMRVNAALKYSVQIADALAAAHAAGIVHRDLTPANVMVTDQGLVKILDFGLAKLTESGETGESGTSGPPEPRTEEGTILGTVAYMSPEQAEGKNVDARSDVFSLGAVLYEMVTGQRAFQGTSKVSTLSAILQQEPRPVSGITQAVPADLEKLINRCLRKDPQRRWQTMADLKVALEELKEDSGRLQVPPGAARLRTRSRFLLVAAACIALVAGGWYWLGRSLGTRPEAPATVVPLTTYPGREHCPSFSPDGNSLAFQWCTEEPSANCDIYIKQIGVEPPFRLTTDPAEDFSPAWSPDGRTIAFLRRLSETRAALMTIPQRGGQERVLEELDLTAKFRLPAPVSYLAWTPDSKWLVVPSEGPDKASQGLSLVSTETLERRILTTPRVGSSDMTPAFSPDGRTMAFTRWGGRSEICFLGVGKNYEPKGEPPSTVTPEDRSSFGAAWTPDGGDIVFRDGYYLGRGLWRMGSSSPDEPVRLAFASDATSAPAISRLGNRLAYAIDRFDTNIYRVALGGPGTEPGSPSKLIQSTKMESISSYSPDGKRIVFCSDRSGAWEFWVCDREGSNAVQLTSLGGDDSDRATWSPDGRSIAFGSLVRGKHHIFLASSSGGIPRDLMTDATGPALWPYWSRDGRSIYFRSRRSGSSEIWRIPAEGGDAVQITPDGGDRDQPQESPDGHFLYYVKGDHYPHQCSVWRTPPTGGEETRIIDATDCFDPFSIVEGGIYFVTPRDEQGHSEIRFRDFSSGATRKIVTTHYASSIGVSPDRRTILYTQPDEVGSDLMLVENFR